MGRNRKKAGTGEVIAAPVPVVQPERAAIQQQNTNLGMEDNGIVRKQQLPDGWEARNDSLVNGVSGTLTFTTGDKSVTILNSSEPFSIQFEVDGQQYFIPIEDESEWYVQPENYTGTNSRYTVPNYPKVIALVDRVMNNNLGRFENDRQGIGDNEYNQARAELSAIEALSPSTLENSYEFIRMVRNRTQNNMAGMGNPFQQSLRQMTDTQRRTHQNYINQLGDTIAQNLVLIAQSPNPNVRREGKKFIELQMRRLAQIQAAFDISSYNRVTLNEDPQSNLPTPIMKLPASMIGVPKGKRVAEKTDVRQERKRLEDATLSVLPSVIRVALTQMNGGRGPGIPTRQINAVIPNFDLKPI